MLNKKKRVKKNPRRNEDFIKPINKNCFNLTDIRLKRILFNNKLCITGTNIIKLIFNKKNFLNYFNKYHRTNCHELNRISQMTVTRILGR